MPGIECAALSNLVESEGFPIALRRLLAVAESSFEQRAHLERALKSRIVIEQAKGVLAERLRVTPDEAFGLLRGAARSRHVRLHDLARDVVDKSDTPAAIIGYLQAALTASGVDVLPTASGKAQLERAQSE